MFNRTFYFGLTRKYVSLFGTMFNDIVIIRQDDNGKNQIIDVPIEYAPKDHMLARIEADPELDRPYSTLLPRMSYEYMPNFQYDGTRKLNTMNKHVARVANDPDKLQYQYGPVPYNIDWNLYIYVKYNEDGAKIIEQILPYFTPELTPTVTLIPELNEVRDIPIVIGNVSKEDRYESDFKRKRMQIWTISFTMKGYFYGPINETGVIKVVNTSFYVANTEDILDSIGNTDVSERFVITPGLDANGNPVNYYGPPPANTTSIPIANITANDDFGYIDEIESIDIINTANSGNNWFG